MDSAVPRVGHMCAFLGESPFLGEHEMGPTFLQDYLTAEELKRVVLTPAYYV